MLLNSSLFGIRQSKYPDIKVSTNVQSTFSISGPEKFTGTGSSWLKDNALPGNYTITFAPLNCWQTPAKETQSLTFWGTMNFSGIYDQKHIDWFINLVGQNNVIQMTTLA
jgi:hypothetical protein